MEPMPSFPAIPGRFPTINSLARAIVAQANARLDRNTRAADYAAQAWPNDPTVPMVLRAAVNPTLTSNAAALMPLTAQFVEALGPLSAAGALVNAGISLTSFGRGTVSVPGFAPGESQFVAEGAPIPVKQFTSSGPTLSPYKLATILVLTAELLDYSNADTLMRAALTESVALGLDKVLLSNQAAVPGLHPAGLLNGIAALTPTAAGGGKTDAMAGDVQLLLTAIAPVAGSGWMIIASPAQAAALGFRLAQQVPNVVTSSALAAGTVIAIAPRAFVSVIEAPRVDSSIEALLHMDDNPAAIANGGGVSAPARSLFQTNSVGLRVIAPASWGLRAPNAVAWMSGVSW
jgi:Phage capsid family